VHNRIILSLSLILLSLLFPACGSSPNARIYILNTMDRIDASSILKNQNITVKIGPISIPDALDKSQIVTRLGTNELLADEFNRWSGDYQSDIQRVLGENISILLPARQVILNQELTLFPVDFQVLVNVREFDGSLGGTVTLNADWTIAGSNKGQPVTAKKSIFQENTNGSDYQSYVAAQSRLLAKLSSEIASEIRKQLNKKD